VINYHSCKLILSGICVAVLIFCHSVNIISCRAEEPLPGGTPPIKVALALGGGGTRGIAHIGVLKVLSEEGIPIDAIAGTSMGALVGGLYCAGVSCSEIAQVFRERKIIHAFDTVPIPLRVGLIPILLLPRLVGHHPYEGLYRGNKFAHYIASLVPENNRNIETLHPKFWAVASNLITGEPYAIKKGNIGRVIQASSAIPVLRRPVELDGQLLVDGGITENVPTEHARAMGCDYVIAVDVDERVMPVPSKVFRALGSVSNRSLNMTLAKIDEPQLAMADAVIHPDLRGIHLLSHKRNDAERAMSAGEQAARAAVPYLKQQLEELRRRRQAGSEQLTKSAVE
jgi:NTE family protein